MTYKIQIDDLVRDATPQEIQEIEARIAAKAAEERYKAEAEAKRFAALAKLEALGLDEDDLKALGL